MDSVGLVQRLWSSRRRWYEWGLTTRASGRRRRTWEPKGRHSKRFAVHDIMDHIAFTLGEVTGVVLLIRHISAIARRAGQHGVDHVRISGLTTAVIRKVRKVARCPGRRSKEMWTDMAVLEGKVFRTVWAVVRDNNVVRAPANVWHSSRSDFVTATVSLGLAGSRDALCAFHQRRLVGRRG
jgi:hypothetical protein